MYSTRLFTKICVMSPQSQFLDYIKPTLFVVEEYLHFLLNYSRVLVNINNSKMLGYQRE